MSSFAFKRREQLRSLYGFDFPDDLFRFWEFVNRLKPLDPIGALWDALEVRLAGPFEVLNGRFDGHSPRLSPLLHWRYYLDPPEFFTAASGSVDKLHWGYYFDDMPGSGGCVASYYGNDVFELSADGDDLFGAMRLQLESDYSILKQDSLEDPKFADEYAVRLKHLETLRRHLLRWATADRPESGEAYFDKYHGAVARTAFVVASTPDGMGVVAPPGSYRSLSLSDKKLRSVLRKLADPLEIVEEARQALRDGFPATALKLGKELWPLRGERKTAYAYELLDAAYEALGREVLREVLRTHREHRDLPSVDILANEASIEA